MTRGYHPEELRVLYVSEHQLRSLLKKADLMGSSAKEIIEHIRTHEGYDPNTPKIKIRTQKTEYVIEIEGGGGEQDGSPLYALLVNGKPDALLSAMRLIYREFDEGRLFTDRLFRQLGKYVRKNPPR
jgi:hypothetical protein